MGARLAGQYPKLTDVHAHRVLASWRPPGGSANGHPRSWSNTRLVSCRPRKPTMRRLRPSHAKATCRKLRGLGIIASALRGW